MHFIVLGYDGKDEKALERRMSVREEHLKKGKELLDMGKWLYAAGMLDEEGKMIGSMIVCDFASKKDLEKEWLNTEAYVVGNVWEKIKIINAQVPPFLLKNNSNYGIK